MSQPPPASTDRMPSTSAKNARTFSASGENTIACIPVITARAYYFGMKMSSVPVADAHQDGAVALAFGRAVELREVQPLGSHNQSTHNRRARTTWLGQRPH